MMPLARFYESDVNESPTVDAFQAPNRGFGMVFPGTTVFLMVITWLGNLLWGKARVAQGRAKVKKAREEVLPLFPNSAICPQCYEVLQRL